MQKANYSRPNDKGIVPLSLAQQDIKGSSWRDLCITQHSHAWLLITDINRWCIADTWIHNVVSAIAKMWHLWSHPCIQYHPLSKILALQLVWTSLALKRSNRASLRSFCSCILVTLLKSEVMAAISYNMREPHNSSKSGSSLSSWQNLEIGLWRGIPVLQVCMCHLC